MTVSDGVYVPNGDGSSEANCKQSCTDNALCDNIAYIAKSTGGFDCYLYDGGSLSSTDVPVGQGYAVFAQIRTNTVSEYQESTKHDASLTIIIFGFSMTCRGPTPLSHHCIT